MVRWSNGKLQPFGGWQQRGYTTFSSTVRRIHRWTTNDDVTMVAYLCDWHLYVDRGDGILEDISPISPILSIPPPLITGGYGGGAYGEGPYGVSPAIGEVEAKAVTPGYYLDNWGQNLVAMTGTDGRLLQWDPESAVGTRAVAVPNAPTNNRGFVVHPLRHIIVFGAGGVMNRYAWCDQEDNENWNFADVNSKAGFQDVQPASPIIACSMSGDEVIFFTENDRAFYIEYVGMPYIFGGEQFASGCTPFSPMSISDSPSGAIWMTNGGVFNYQSRSAVPVNCAVWNWIVENRDEIPSRYSGSVYVVPSQNEMWFSFASGGTSGVNDRTAVFNYVEKWWAQAYIGRTAGITSTYTGYPVMSDGRYVYDHEVGNSYGTDQLPWVATFPITIGSGSDLITMPKFFPDYDGDIDAISVSLEYNIPRTTENPDVVTEDSRVLSDGYVYFDMPTGRDFRLTVRQVMQADPWTLGDSVVYIIPRGAQ